MLVSKLKVVGRKMERKIVPHQLIDLSESAMTTRRERYVNSYKWFIRKDNRFKYTASDGYLDFGMFDAFDESCIDYNDFIDRNNLMEKDRQLAISLNKKSSERREQKLRKRIKKLSNLSIHKNRLTLSVVVLKTR
jgi:hypothetical protein